MANAQYARPSENVAPNATPSLTAGTANAAFPLANLIDLNPAKPFKATGTSATIRFTFGGSQTIKAIVIVTHNLVGATVALTNNGGMASQAIAIPANAEDGHSVNPFKDLSLVASNAGTQWDLAITGAANPIAIGEILLLSEWRTLTPNVDWGIDDVDIHPAIVHRTDGGVRLVYDRGVRWRELDGLITGVTDAQRALLLALARDARNHVKNWPFVLDPLVNDARFLHFADERVGFKLEHLDSSPFIVRLQEESRGLPL
jgi:hypothetical protein